MVFILQTAGCSLEFDICLLQAKLADNPTSAGVVYVVQDANNGQVVLPPVTGNEQPNAKDAMTFKPQIILSCFVFWLCGFLFGLIAFILASK